MELLLSQYMGVNSERVTPISKYNQCSQTIFVVVDAITRYIAFLEDWDTISNLLLFS